MGLTLKWCVGAALAGLCACGHASRSSGDATDGQGGAAGAVAGAGQGGAAGAVAGAGQGGAAGAVGRWGAAFNDAQAGRTATECNSIADDNADEMPSETFTAVLRFDYQTLSPLGHAFVVHGLDLATESDARATANSVTFPFASTPAGNGKLLTDPSVTDKWVFLTEPSDFGGVAIESSDATLQFVASIVWSGTGEILLPSSWSKRDLGSGCAPRPSSAAATSQVFQLTSEASLDPKITDVALTTVLPRVWEAFHAVLNRTSVFVYPRTVGSFEPAKAEYIVLLDVITPIR